MAIQEIEGTPIGKLPALEEITGAEQLPVETGTGNARVTLEQVKEYAQEGLSAPYALAEWTEGELDPEAASFVGDPGLLAEWDGLLLDTTDNAGVTTVPVGRLKRNNWLRFEDGTFAPMVGITEEQRAQCDAELYLDAGRAQKYCDAGAFDAEAFYSEYGMSQKLWAADGTEIAHILRPWETTETKYTIGVANRRKLWLADQAKGKSGKAWRGVSASPKTYDGLDLSAWPLERTALSPSPVCTVGGKAWAFFFLYEGETNCKSSAGEGGCCTMFQNGRTYPRTNDMQQASNMNYARANNADAEKPYPFAEGGYHALNAFVTCMEAFCRTKYLHRDTLFSSGVSSNDTCNSEETWKLHGGVRYRKTGEEEWKYANWNGQGDIYYSASQQRTHFSTLLNKEHPKTQCMEMQVAASFAAETGVPEGTEFELYGGTYRWQAPSGVRSLNDGEMNAVMYKRMSQTFAAYDAEGLEQSWDVEAVLRVGLMQGMDVSGDVFAYWGGGYEHLGTCVKLQSESKLGNPISLYLQPDQTKWEYETAFTKNEGESFGFEGTYMKTGETESLQNGYCLERVPYAAFKKSNGGGLGQGECFYSESDNNWSNVVGQKARTGARFRGAAFYGYCSPRRLLAHHAASYANRFYAGSAQALIGAAPPQAE